MSLLDNDRQEELFLLIGDHWRAVNRNLLMSFLAILVMSIPGFFFTKYIFTKTISSRYVPPAVLPLAASRTPIEVVEKKILRINPTTYSGFVKLSNVNLDWGIPDQTYTARVTSKTGKTLLDYTGRAFILPSSQKVLVLPRFSSDSEPFAFDFALEPSRFIGKPKMPEIKLDLQRTQMRVESGSQIVSAVVINSSPFKVARIDLPVVLFDSKNQPVAANFTNVNEVLSGETRSFQYYWPNKIEGAVRAEIRPEVNIFLPNVIKTEGSRSQFD